jgi:hypothetical protein
MVMVNVNLLVVLMHTVMSNPMEAMYIVIAMAIKYGVVTIALTNSY